MKKSIAIIGGGPAGLMAAEILSQNFVTVDLYESMSSLGRKFLMAGKSGLNLTHAEPYHTFITRYGDKQKQIETHLNHFKPDDLLAWVKGLGIETYIGSSGRIFPKEMKASPLLRAWLQRLQTNGVTFHTRHHWKGWQEKFLIFEVRPECQLKRVKSQYYHNNLIFNFIMGQFLVSLHSQFHYG